jgi:hypothetical protein
MRAQLIGQRRFQILRRLPLHRNPAKQRQRNVS